MKISDITSKDNMIVKQTRELLQAKFRRETGLFTAEGLRLAEEAVQASAHIVRCLFTEEFASTPRGSRVLETAEAKGAELYRVPQYILESCADTVNPQGVITVQPMPEPLRFDSLQASPLLLLCDGISDPGNLGTIMRLAYAVGADGLVLLPDCVEPFNPKVVRSSMGGVFRVPFVQMQAEEAFAAVQEHGLQLVIADGNAEKLYWQQDMRKGTALLLGNEAKGVSEFWRGVPAESVKLPMPGGAESLNVAMSAGILCYEVLRQRSLTVK